MGVGVREIGIRAMHLCAMHSERLRQGPGSRLRVVRTSLALHPYCIRPRPSHSMVNLPVSAGAFPTH